MLLEKSALKFKNVIFVAVIITILLTLRYVNLKNGGGNDDALPKNTVFADTTKTITLKVSLGFNADIDTTGRVDGEDLAYFSEYFGMAESVYVSKTYGAEADINKDQIIDGNDLTILGSRFGMEK